MSDHWSEYWKQGFITSFGDAFKNNYQGEIKTLWQDFSLSLNKNSKILDIGTGNGAVIELIQSVSQHDCIGIDLAKINDNVVRQINGRFISNVSAEDMSFKNNSFDVVISQFALEYSNIQPSLNEIHRVLKPTGKLNLVCHKTNSIIVAPNMLILEAGLRIKENILSELKCLVDALTRNKSTISYQNNIEYFISSFELAKKEALEATNFPAFYQFIIKTKNIDFNEAYNLFESELNLLLLRLSELKFAAENTEALLLEINNNKAFSKIEIKELKDKSNNLLAVTITAEK